MCINSDQHIIKMNYSDATDAAGLNESDLEDVRDDLL